MPPLYQQILKQKSFQKGFDTKLEIETRVAKKVAEIDKLKASGLSLSEMRMESEGASAIIDFLKEYDRKQNEKAAMGKVIDKTERRL